MEKALTQVQGTAYEALGGKLSASQKGYYSDPFLPLCFPPQRPNLAMSPLINRGYFARVRALDKIISSFLSKVEASCPAPLCEGKRSFHSNIIVLGAGLDTTYFRLQDTYKGGLLANYIELDFPDVCTRKAALISTHQTLRSLVGPLVEASSSSITDPQGGSRWSVLMQCNTGYRLLAGDLSNTAQIHESLQSSGVDFLLPTLIIAECVLVYMEPHDTEALIDWAAKSFPDAVFASYDMIRPGDSFGKMMITNLKERGLRIPSFSRYPDAESQLNRYIRRGGWERAMCADMNRIYSLFIDAAERNRVSRLEILDEMEEWTLLMGHYCYVVASKGAIFANLLEEEKAFDKRKNRASIGIEGNGQGSSAGTDI